MGALRKRQTELHKEVKEKKKENFHLRRDVFVHTVVGTLSMHLSAQATHKAPEHIAQASSIRYHGNEKLQQPPTWQHRSPPTQLRNITTPAKETTTTVQRPTQKLSVSPQRAAENARKNLGTAKDKNEGLRKQLRETQEERDDWKQKARTARREGEAAAWDEAEPENESLRASLKKAQAFRGRKNLPPSPGANKPNLAPA